MKCFLTLLAIAAGLTIAASPRFQRALFANPKDQPSTPDDWAPKYAIGGQYVTRDQFDLYDAYRRGEITRKEWSDATFTNLAARPDWGIPA